MNEVKHLEASQETLHFVQGDIERQDRTGLLTECARRPQVSYYSDRVRLLTEGLLLFFIYNHPMDRYRITDGMGVYFITFTIVDWLPVFVDEIPITTLIDSLKYCIAHKNLRVNAYVIMPNHFHAVIFDAAFDPLNLKRALTDFRKFSGRQLSDYVDARYSKEVAAVLKNDELKDRERRFWQSGWHAEGIFSEHFLEQKVNYLHWNPCRKGLVRSPQDWRYSSAAYWLDGKQVDLPVSAVEWEG